MGLEAIGIHRLALRFAESQVHSELRARLQVRRIRFTGNLELGYRFTESQVQSGLRARLQGLRARLQVRRVTSFAHSGLRLGYRFTESQSQVHSGLRARIQIHRDTGSQRA